LFVDRVTIYVKAGNGGDGCVSFRREKYVPKGGPDGGDGGKGGSVILKADRGEQSLVSLRFNQHCTAKHGGHGRGKGCHGAAAQDSIVRVPIGTLVFSEESGELLGDLTEDEQEMVVGRGGRGGAGNPRFANSQRRTPRIATPGKPGQECRLILELKTIADAGLVGYPNAGKSTLIAAISDARPKTAPYPFTTLHPVVGVVEFPDFFRYTIADIPGLIDGAHENVGLGHEFLRHVERCHVLVYILDTAGVDGRNPLDDYAALKRELELHQEGLSQRPSIVVANKVDLPDTEENFAELQEKLDVPVLPVSALNSDHTDELSQTLRELIESVQATKK
jgi:GTPase